MVPASRDIAIYRGDVYTHELTFTDSATPPAPLNVSGYTFTAQVRAQPSRATGDPMAIFTVDATRAAAGIIVLSLTEAQTAALASLAYWDLQVEPIGQTWLAGRVTVAGDVTH